MGQSLASLGEDARESVLLDDDLGSGRRVFHFTSSGHVLRVEAFALFILLDDIEERPEFEHARGL